MIDRRALVAATPALLAGPALARDAAVRGSRAYSESAMVMSVTPDGRSALTLRFCRFPIEGQTWLWCHIFHEGRFYAFTRHDLPCSPDRLAGAQLAEYRAAPAQAELVRVRRGDKPPAVRLAADLKFHESPTAPHGPGDKPGKFTAQFLAVSPLGTQVLEGREEVYGWCSAQVEIGGHRFVHEGLAKFHEQRQEAARFEAPFCYAFLSGDSMNCTALLHARGATGGWQIDGVETALADMTLDRPGPVRAVAWKMRDKPALIGRIESLVRYEIPIYDRHWNGSFVKGACDGRPIVGAMNDWVVAPDIYAAAVARASQS